eukprot:TRINITY_DN20232_c0_g1_i1.p1 TRINITY_DN20232_c0_g1~~TRINITY_DN20232_c0_g1_i1.p1  ORF type:complete len:299 (-),score=54.80 TRINITY_DN20232_c0_g1_i1:51-947(-)
MAGEEAIPTPERVHLESRTGPLCSRHGVRRATGVGAVRSNLIASASLQMLRRMCAEPLTCTRPSKRVMRLLRTLPWLMGRRLMYQFLVAWSKNAREQPRTPSRARESHWGQLSTVDEDESEEDTRPSRSRRDSTASVASLSPKSGKQSKAARAHAELLREHAEQEAAMRVIASQMQTWEAVRLADQEVRRLAQRSANRATEQQAQTVVAKLRTVKSSGPKEEDQEVSMWDRARTSAALRGVTHLLHKVCLLYTSDAADEEDSVDLGGRRIIKKKKNGQAKGRDCGENKVQNTVTWLVV